MRTALIERKTAETDIKLELNIDGSGKTSVYTGIGFLDHMLTLFARHGFMDLSVQASGDVEVDSHHTAEDVGIVLGQAIAKALVNKEGITRYGSLMLPMEEALVLCALDISGRPYLAFDGKFSVPRLGMLDTEMIEEFFRAVVIHAGLNLHIKVLDGKNNHHIAEAMFKAFGRALDAAAKIDARIDGVLSTKGLL